MEESSVVDKIIWLRGEGQKPLSLAKYLPKWKAIRLKSKFQVFY